MIPLFMTKRDAFSNVETLCVSSSTREVPATSLLIGASSDTFVKDIPAENIPTGSSSDIFGAGGNKSGLNPPKGPSSDTLPEDILMLRFETTLGTCMNNLLVERNLVDALTLNSLYVTKTLCRETFGLPSGKERTFY